MVGEEVAILPQRNEALSQQKARKREREKRGRTESHPFQLWQEWQSQANGRRLRGGAGWLLGCVQKWQVRVSG